MDQTLEMYLKKRLVYPSHLQVSFYADHLENFVSSNEISIPNKASFHTQLEWRENDLP
jgi:hypothetical protein